MTERLRAPRGTHWITWEDHRRTQSICAQLDIPCHVIDVHGGRLARYARSLWRTLRVLLAERPSSVIVQCPSIVLTTFGVLVAPLLGARVIVDSHNAGLRPMEGRSALANAFCRWVLGSAYATILTNSVFADGSGLRRVILLPDPLPTHCAPPANHVPAARDDARRRCFVPSSWSDDEPLEALVEAAARVAERWQIRISGRPKAQRIGEGPHPGLHLCGFVDEQAYLEELWDCDLVLALTTRQDSVLCGLAEGIGAGKPVLASRAPALDEVFAELAAYTENTAEGIADALDADDLVPPNTAALARYEGRWWSAAGALLAHLR